MVRLACTQFGQALAPDGSPARARLLLRLLAALVPANVLGAAGVLGALRGVVDTALAAAQASEWGAWRSACLAGRLPAWLAWLAAWLVGGQVGSCSWGILSACCMTLCTGWPEAMCEKEHEERGPTWPPTLLRRPGGGRRPLLAALLRRACVLGAGGAALGRGGASPCRAGAASGGCCLGAQWQ